MRLWNLMVHGDWENGKEIVKKARKGLEKLQKARERSGGLYDVDIKHFIKLSPTVTWKRKWI